MRLQRYYFLFYLVMIIPNFFILTPTGLTWSSVFTCLHPIIIIVILLWAISINAQSLERKSGGNGGDGKQGGVGEGKGTELSDYSSFLDDSRDVSVNEGYRGPAEHMGGKGDFEDKDLG
jgi:hypothetical protein